MRKTILALCAGLAFATFPASAAELFPPGKAPKDPAPAAVQPQPTQPPAPAVTAPVADPAPATAATSTVAQPQPAQERRKAVRFRKQFDVEIDKPDWAKRLGQRRERRIERRGNRLDRLRSHFRDR